jgi:hypothetical protein
MTATKAAIDDLVQWFVKPGPTGIVGLADDLVRYCAENNLSIHFTDSLCDIVDESGEHEVAVHGLPRYALRALLVRMTVLCENTKDINPYGGEGLIKLTDATVSMRMTNTNALLELHLAPARD